MVEPTTGTGRALHIAAGLALWALLVLSSAPRQIQTLEGRLVASSPDQFRSVPGAVRSYDVRTEARPGPFPNVFRLAYPPEWLSREGDASRPLVLFIDGRKAAWLPEEPFFDQLDSRRIYAYLREPKSQSLFVVCPRDTGCSRVEFVRNSLSARGALAASLPEISRPAGFRMAVEALLFGILAWLAGTRLSRPWLASLVLLLAGNLYLAQGPEGEPGLTGTVAVGLAVLAGPSRALGGRLFDWSAWVCRPGAGVARPQVLLFILVAFASSWLGLRTIPGWYPTHTDDSLFYLSAASRFLRTDGLLAAALDMENWRYSAYPLAVAALSKGLGLHPMAAYAWVSAIGALALVSAAGILAWFATGRLTTALMTLWISGAWGGLGVWVWAFERVPAFFRTGALRLLDTDFHEPRFLGEFTGPYSELAAYISSAPLYPREAGLVPFWLGLALLYRRLHPGLSPPSLFAVCGLFLMSVALYPYYGFAAVIAFGIVAIAEGSGDDAMRRRRRQTVIAGALVLLASGILGDLASRVYRRQSAWDWLTHFLAAAPLAVDAAKPMPSLDFLAPRMLGGQFFLAVAFLGALLAGLRPVGSLPKPQRRAAWLTLGVCLTHGLASQASAYIHMILFNFRWYISWRGLLTPITALVAALFVEGLMARGGKPSRARLAVLLLTPSLGPLLWSWSVTDYQDRERDRGSARGQMAAIWSDYGRYGTEVLGKVVIPEPLAIEGASLGERAAAGAAFGVFVPEMDPVFANGGASLPSTLGAPNGVNSVALRRESPAAARLRADACCRILVSYGPYDLFVRTSRQAAPPP